MAFVATNQRLGQVDLLTVVTAGNVGAPFISGSNNPLPSVTVEPYLGEIAYGSDTTNGWWGEFIWLAVPTSTTITKGLLYYWKAGASSSATAGYSATVLPAAAAGNSGLFFACAINTVSSNTSSVQYTWFQITGVATVLKTAVQVLPNVAVYQSATAGRVTNVASTLKTIIGMRSANAATVTTTTSSILCFMNRPNCGPGI